MRGRRGSGRARGGRPRTGGDVRTYGESAADADLRIVDLVLKGSGARFDAVLHGRRLGPVQLAVPGRHNALDAAAALLAGLGLGLPDDGCARAWRPSPAPGGGWS